MDRFWNKVHKTDDCWLWTGRPNRDGYGQFKLDGKVWRAHQVAFYLTHLKWPDQCVCHTCDNPACVRPEHLFEGSNWDNMQDKMRKRRHRSFTYFSSDEVVLLRELYATGVSSTRISRTLEIPKATLLSMLNGSTHKHCGGPIKHRGANSKGNRYSPGSTGVSKK